VSEFYPRDRAAATRPIRIGLRMRGSVQFVVNFGGGENKYPARRSRLKRSFVGCQAQAAGPAPRQYRIDVRIWFARRLLAVGGCSPTRMRPLCSVATALKRNPAVAMKEAGRDIASHSLKWVEHKGLSEERREIAG
jgi:hypothetical protein